MHTKKALSLILALALVLSCIPALAGTAAADTGMTAVSTYALSEVTTSLTQDLTWIDIRNTNSPIEVHGLYNYTDRTLQNGNFVRMDPTVASAVTSSSSQNFTTNSGNIWGHNQDTSGGRVRFSTNSRYIALQALLPVIPTWGDYTGKENASFEIYVDTNDGRTLVHTIEPSSKLASGRTNYTLEGIVDLGTDEIRNITIYMPLLNPVKELYIGLSSNAQIGQNSKRYMENSHIVYLGSSITQGGSTENSSGSYVALTSYALNSDFTNLGMWGSCYAQKGLATYIAKLDMSIFVFDYDHNSSSPDDLNKTNDTEYSHYDFYNFIRNSEKHKNTPIIIVSRPNNATGISSEFRDVIIKTFDKAVAEGDKNIHFVDGEAFFNYQIDYNGTNYLKGVHPSTAGQMAMADVMTSVLRLVNAGYENIYFGLDKISFGNGQEDIIFDSTNTVNAMTQANWTSGTVSGKTLALAASQNATLQGIENLDKLSGYTAVAALNIASGASATVTIGGQTVTVSANGNITCGDESATYVPKANANGSVDAVVGITCIDNGFTVKVNETSFHVENGVMGGQLSYGAVGGAVTVNSLMITAPTVRASYQATLNSAITLNMNMYLSDAAQGAYAKFTSNGKTSDAVQPVEKDGIYTFSYGVAAKNMADAVDVEIYNSENQMIAKHTVSIKNYADIIRTGDYSGKDQAVATALLNYGAAMQVYKGHNTGNLANGSFAAGWDSAAANIDLSKYQPSASGSDALPEGVQFYATSLLMEDKTIIRHYFKMSDTTAAGITVSEDNNPLTLFKSESGNGYYCVDIPVDAANLDYMYTLNLTDGTKTFQVRYSALSYVLQVLNPPENYSPNENMVRLAKAIYLYSVAVEAPDQSDDEFEILPF